MGVLLTAFLLAVFHYPTSGDVSTALAALTGTIGTIVGAYFGVQAGGSGANKAANQAEVARQAAEQGRQDAEQGRQEATTTALKLAAAASPEVAVAVTGEPTLGTSGQATTPGGAGP
ncbi:MAG TPA: hypothetical protein VGH76_20615 [Actinomycetospora sp.]|uniref:hypothetical protein n=1 Tax=Actinomycetospora sp. TaxID=1872135 RepID=UPI002F42CD81